MSVPKPSTSAAPLDGRAEARAHDPDLVQHWIGGRLTSGSGGGRLLDVFNPATGAVTARAVAATTDDVAAAVASAAAAFPAWADMPPVRRARVLNRYLSLLNEHRHAIAKVITSEHGK